MKLSTLLLSLAVAGALQPADAQRVQCGDCDRDLDIDVLDAAITDISSLRSDIGATENRLQITVANLSSARENISAANSRIRDVDVAEETAALTRNNILQQAGVSVLAQANQAPLVLVVLLELKALLVKMVKMVNLVKMVILVEMVLPDHQECL